MRLPLLFGLMAMFCQACSPGSANQPEPGAPSPSNEMAAPAPVWRAELQLGEHFLPFNFFLDPTSPEPEMTLVNGAERLQVPDVERRGDSMRIRMPFFDSEFRVRLDDDSLTGIWHNRARPNKNVLPFRAKINDPARFDQAAEPAEADLGGKWEVTFVYQESDTSKAIGQFEQVGEQLTGTFLTPTGDYRFLEGSVYGRKMYLSCFDGAHAFLFEAEIREDGSLAGEFWSGAHWHETWTAVRNPNFSIAHPDSLTWLKEGYETLEFAFPNADSEMVSLTDERYRGKVVIVDIMGTWCPNCIDEILMLQEFYAPLHPEGLEVISLAFESRDDFAYAAGNVKRLCRTFGLEHEMLIAGKAGPRTAGAALPMLNHVMSYPTTIFIGRNGKVRRIYTGFSGHATGEHFARLREDFHRFIRELLAESPV